MATSKQSDNATLSPRVATKLTDVTEPYQWYSLQIPGLEKLEPRVGHAIVSLKLGKIMMIGGGNHEGAMQQVFTINLQPSDQDSPEDRVKAHPATQDFVARYEFSCAKDASNNVWLFGGANVQNTMNEVIRIDEESIVEVATKRANATDSKEGAGPSSRTQGSNSALVEWKGKSYIAVFAGGLKGEQAVKDRNLYLFDIEDWTWLTVDVKMDNKLMEFLPFGCQPPAVQGHVMTAIGSKVKVFSNKILVHGGISELTLYDGFHWMDLGKENGDLTHSWIDKGMDMCSELKPSARAAHGTAKVSDVDKSSPVVYMFGGLGEKAPCNDLWSVNFESGSWTQLKKNGGANSTDALCPPPRLDFGMCAVGWKDEDSGNISVYLVVHGGMNPQGELFNDAWVLKVS